jgi:Zn-dependent protease/predicted transcriptional regulator
MANGGLGSGWPIARIFGITIRLHVSWLVIFALLTFSLGTQIIPLSNLADGGSWWEGAVILERAHEAYPWMSIDQVFRYNHVEQWSATQVWVLAVIGTLGLFVCVVAHELSHSIVAHGAGIHVEGITLFVFGGVSRLKEEAHTPGVEFRVAIAGPLMSLVLAGACAGMYYGLAGWLPGQAQTLLYYFFFINMALLVFNLLPGFPLDGGRVLRAILWAALRDVRKATAIASACGKALAGLLIFIGSTQFFFRGFDLGALWWIVIGLFLWSAAGAGYRQLALHDALAGMTVKDVIQKDAVSAPPDVSLDRLVDEYFYQYRFHSFPVLEGDRLVGTISLRDVQDVPRADWPLRTVRDAMHEIRAGAVVHPQEDLESVFRKMVEEGRGHLPVVDDGRLVGIVTRHDMLTLLQLRTNLGGGVRPRPQG